MKVNLYLHKEIVQILKLFGDLTDVINKIVNEYIDSCDLSSLPQAPEKTDATKYVIDIDNETYSALVESYGPTSSKCSIRRLIYYFVEGEMYSGWPIVSEYKDERIEYVSKRVKELKYICKRIKSKCESDELDITQKIEEFVSKLEVLINEKRNK